MIDFDYLVSEAVTLLGTTKVKGALTTVPVAGFATIGGCRIDVDVNSIRGTSIRSVTLIVEDSPDGNSWSTVHSWSFSEPGTGSFETTDVDDLMRVRFATSGGLREATVGSVVVVPARDASVSGGSQPITVLGPFTVNYNTPGFVNPSNNGIATLAVPAGSLLLDVIPITTVVWKATGNVDLDAHDELDIGVSPSGDVNGTSFARFALGSTAPDNPTISLAALAVEDAGLQGGSVEAVDWSSQRTPVLAVADCFVVVGAGISEAALVAGSLKLYAIIATPS